MSMFVRAVVLDRVGISRVGVINTPLKVGRDDLADQLSRCR